MPVSEVVRDSFVGQIIYHASGRRLLNYLEDRPDFILPEKFRGPRRDVEAPNSDANSDTATLADRRKSDKADEANVEKRPVSVVVQRAELEESTVGQEILRSPTREIEKGKLAEEQARRAEEDQENPFIVTWYTHDDPENPQNVSLFPLIRAIVSHTLLVTVVVREEVLRHVRHLPPHIQHIHRFRHLHARYSGHHRKIRDLPRRSDPRAHIIRHWVRYRTHVPLATLRDTPARSHIRLYHHARSFRRHSSPYSISEEPRCTSPAALPRWLCRLACARHRRRVPHRYLVPGQLGDRHWPVESRRGMRSRPWALRRWLRRPGRRLDMDYLDPPLAERRVARLPCLLPPRDLSAGVSVFILGMQCHQWLIRSTAFSTVVRGACVASPATGSLGRRARLTLRA